MLGNTLTACWWVASGFVVYYSITALFATHLQKDLNLSPGLVATPIAIANFVGFLAMGFWGSVGDRIGRRWSMIIPSAVTVLVAPLYLLTNDFTLIVVGFALHALFPPYSQLPSYLCERFPTEVRATASGFCYHQGAIFGGLVPPVLTYIAVNYGVGLGVPMLAGTAVGVVSYICALLLSPETKGKVLAADLVLA
jgi:MFS transporter, SHS family, lactate transporter